MPIDWQNWRRSSNVDYGEPQQPSWLDNTLTGLSRTFDPSQVGGATLFPNWNPLGRDAGLNETAIAGYNPNPPYDASFDARLNFDPNSGPASDYASGLGYQGQFSQTGLQNAWGQSGGNDESYGSDNNYSSFDPSGWADAGFSNDYGSDFSGGYDYGGGEYSQGGTVGSYAIGGPMRRFGSFGGGFDPSIPKTYGAFPGQTASFNPNIPPNSGLPNLPGGGGFHGLGTASNTPTGGGAAGAASNPMASNVASGRSAFSFDDGGVVNFNNPTNATSPLDLVREAFDYGRKKFGLNFGGSENAQGQTPIPQDDETQGYARGGSVGSYEEGDSVGYQSDSTTNPDYQSAGEGYDPTAEGPAFRPVPEQRDTPYFTPPEAGGSPFALGNTVPMSEAPAGSVPQQGLGEQGPQLSKLYDYARQPITNSAKPEQVKQIQMKVDPTGQADPDLTAINTIAEAYKLNSEFGLQVLNYYKGRYEMQRAYAARALNGIDGGREADLGVAVDAANQAYSKMPDNMKIKFSLEGNGIGVAINGQKVRLTPEQFNEFLKGNTGQFDNVYEKGGGAIFASLAKGAGLALKSEALPEQAKPKEQGPVYDDPVSESARKAGISKEFINYASNVSGGDMAKFKEMLQAEYARMTTSADKRYVSEMGYLGKQAHEEAANKRSENSVGQRREAAANRIASQTAIKKLEIAASRGNAEARNAIEIMKLAANPLYAGSVTPEQKQWANDHALRYEDQGGEAAPPTAAGGGQPTRGQVQGNAGASANTSVQLKMVKIGNELVPYRKVPGGYEPAE